MKPHPPLLAAALVAVLAGCAGDEAPVSSSIADACAAGDGKAVVVEGYLRLPESLQITDTATIKLFAARGGRGTSVDVELPIGDGPSQLRDVPARFSVTSLRVQAVGGKTVTINDRVSLTAKVSTDEAGGCVLTEAQVKLASG